MGPKEVRRGIGVIVNPRSRRNRGERGTVDRLTRLVGRDGFVAEVTDEASLDRVAADFVSRGIEVLALSGGDGTTGVTLTGFRRVYGERALPRVALLRGGTMNTIANGLGVPRRRPEVLLAALLRATRRGEPLVVARRASMDVGGRLVFLFGLGIARTFLEEYYARGRPHPTALTAAETLGAIAASAVKGGALIRKTAARVEVSVEVDGRRFVDEPVVGLFCGTVEQLGLGFRPFFRAGDGQEGFHLVSVHGSPPLIVKRLYRVRLGREMGPDVTRETLAREAVIAVRGGGEVRFIADGDLEECASPVRVTRGPWVDFVWGAER